MPLQQCLVGPTAGKDCFVLTPSCFPQQALIGPSPPSGAEPHLASPLRLTYWLSYAFGRSFRAFGFAMTFLPLVAMLLWNLYSMFVLEPENLLAMATAKPEESSQQSRARLRYWG